MNFYNEPERELPASAYDVVVAGGGTGGVIAAIAAARGGAKTVLVESKGYVGGIAVEGGTALHSFYNLWKAFPGVEKKQIVKGIPLELVDRLTEMGGTSGHAEMDTGYDYDSVCTAIDTELYKLLALTMLEEAGVRICINTMLTGAVTNDSRITGVIVESRSGREVFWGHTIIDCTGYGDLCYYAGAQYTEPNDHPVANSIGVGGVDIDAYRAFLAEHNALSQSAFGSRSGRNNQVVRVDGDFRKLSPKLAQEADRIGMSAVTTTVHDDYFMFIKINFKMPVSPTDRDASVAAEIELRKRQQAAIKLLRKYIPGCEKAFIARTSPSLCIRRGRCIRCDYDISLNDILEAKHFEDEVMIYGFHDCAPAMQIKNGGSYGLPYRALCVTGIDNLLTAGMTITSDWAAHMSTRNTVCCMGQGQAAGTAAALCAQQDCGVRELPFADLRTALVSGGVYLE